MAIAVSRYSATSTAAVNTAAPLVVLGSNTAAGNIVTPAGTNAILGVIGTFSTDGTGVGAAIGSLELLLTTSGTQRFLAGGFGGQNATGDSSNVLPSDMMKTMLPVGAGESFAVNGYCQVTDTGAQAFGATLWFGKANGPRTWHDVRTGLAAALNTPVSLLTVGNSTAGGGFNILDTYHTLYAYTVCAASDSAAVGQTTADVQLDGGSVMEGGSQAVVAGAAGGTLNTSMGTHVAAKTYELPPEGVKITGPGSILASGTLHAVDPGNVAIGIGLHFSA